MSHSMLGDDMASAAKMNINVAISMAMNIPLRVRNALTKFMVKALSVVGFGVSIEPIRNMCGSTNRHLRRANFHTR